MTCDKRRLTSICELRKIGSGRKLLCKKGDMKRANYLSGLAVVLTFAGCASNQQSSASANTGSSAKTYESQDLARTGKRTSGEALQAADPAVTARGGN